jgi:sugar lactone lactonase YvrE
MDANVRVLAEGLTFGEGPRWHDGRLWLSDFHDHQVKSVGVDGDLRVELELDDQPSGLGWMPDGSLLVVSMVARKLLRRDGDRLVEHADLGDVATWHCNDMVVDAQGRAYVGNFGFDLEGETATRGRAAVMQDHARASMAMVAPDGTVSVAAEDLEFPNGTVITPDGRTLIVAESFGGRLTAFDVAPDGTLSDRRTFAELAGRVPDGICLDADGAVWVANAIAPECVRVADGGEVLQVVATDQACFACMLGGEDGRSLFMLTAGSVGAERSTSRSGHVLVTEVDVPHAGLP